MATSLFAVSASASPAKPFNIIGEGYGLRVEETSIDAYTTEWIVTDNLTGQIDLLRTEIDADGNCSSYGWYDIAGRNIDSDNTLSSDMSVIVTGDKLLYREKGRNASILFSVADIRESVLKLVQNNITAFPSPWASTPPVYGSAGTAMNDALTIAALLAGIFSVGAVFFLGLAAVIVEKGISTIYYKKVHYYRAKDPLTQESYDVIYFYSDPEYRDLTDTVTTPVSTTYFG